MDTCATCPENRMLETGNSQICTLCGREKFVCNPLMQPSSRWGMELRPTQTYTRLKRFRKYLQRAGRQQCAASVPQETWEYLLARRPYRGPRHIVLTLKRAGKRLRKKCYDCLPLLAHNLCPHLNVPTLDEAEKLRALSLFGVLDRAFKRDGPFVSYLFALEYILRLLGRRDVLPYINKIQCPTRREAYNMQFARLFRVLGE